MLAAQVLGVDVLAHVRVGDEAHAFRFEQRQAALDHRLLLELHVRDAVHEQPADAVVALVDGDGVAGAVELVGGGEAGRARADDRDLLAARSPAPGAA